ncbi:tripartite tricarboxylate transporter TctB family protein [Nocardiopsis dassonvillei]|uniref:tripartite tricarboxylate transporter TctB family protein n=1 Tax=Nocardiopsis dassonvillei TaxID=2014 RepID=UPI00157CD2EE|nr:tripartite tricarboxylate transporter TctB family protein [Nocardiopsis dassonvillei]
MTALSNEIPVAQAPPTGGRDYGELVVAAVLFSLSAFCAYNTVTMEVIGDSSPGPQVFPAIVAVLLCLSGVGVTARVLTRERRRSAHSVPAAPVSDTAPTPAEVNPIPASAAPSEPQHSEDTRVDWRTLLLVVLSFVVFLAVLRPVGWILSAAALFWAVSFALGTRKHALNAAVALVFSCAVQIAFSIGLGLNLPAGVIGGLLSWIS